MLTGRSSRTPCSHLTARHGACKPATSRQQTALALRSAGSKRRARLVQRVPTGQWLRSSTVEGSCVLHAHASNTAPVLTAKHRKAKSALLSLAITPPPLKGHWGVAK